MFRAYGEDRAAPADLGGAAGAGVPRLRRAGADRRRDRPGRVLLCTRREQMGMVSP